MRKLFICLAKSKKYDRFCIAGKEILPDGSIGEWIRPIHPETNSIPESDCIFNIGDIVSVNISNKHPHNTQPENYLLAKNADWNIEGKLDKSKFNLLLDDTNSIWGVGESCCSSYGVNDKVEENLAISHNNSLLFLFLPKAIVWKRDQSTEIRNSVKLRLNFIFKNNKYSLVITDPTFSKKFWDRLSIGQHETIYNTFITISLGEPFHGYCYKLIAGHINV